MPATDVLSRSLAAFEGNSTLVAVIDMSLSSWVFSVWFPASDAGRRRSSAPMRRVCCRCYTGGATRLSGVVALSIVSALPSRRVVTASGWLVGSNATGSSLMSFMPAAFR